MAKDINSPGGKGVQVLAPATVANLVCGFDVLGMALQQPQDVMTVRLTEKPRYLYTKGRHL